MRMHVHVHLIICSPGDHNVDRIVLPTGHDQAREDEYVDPAQALDQPVGAVLRVEEHEGEGKRRVGGKDEVAAPMKGRE